MEIPHFTVYTCTISFAKIFKCAIKLRLKVAKQHSFIVSSPLERQ